MRVSTIVALFVAICVSASADQGRVEIGPADTFPIVIDEPGSYVLTADLHVTTVATNAIEIAVNDVDLDLGGHVIRGPGPGSPDQAFGIWAPSRSGCSIRNGSITEIYRGIYIGSSAAAGFIGGNRLSNLTVSDCSGSAVQIRGGTARDIVVFNAGITNPSFYAFEADNSSLSNVTVRSSSRGMNLVRGTAENCLAENNDGTGITAESMTMSGCAAIGNGENGFGVIGGTVLSSCIAIDNDGVGIYLLSGSNNNVINCTGSDNGANIVGCGDGNGCHQNYLP
ncbi:MAG: right-handed parallel beta-helix repeat-containing protein [Thermoanaerobaculales bacterium]|jgi:parallel beta-helix repeat protein|nr:right-handed parallel beta-helix repeat-containing protein [Thermoanaerobaculales bacterium]